MQKLEISSPLNLMSLQAEQNMLLTKTPQNLLSVYMIKLIALSYSCKLTKDEQANIYIDHRYDLGLVYNFEIFWKQRVWGTATGGTIEWTASQGSLTCLLTIT